MNTCSLTWIFTANTHVPDIYTGNQLWQQNISNLKKILIMDVLQIAEVEPNLIILKT